MSQESVELVRAAYREGYARRTVEPFRDKVADDFRFHMRRGWPGRPVYGFDELTQIWADLDETYSEFRLVPEDFAPIGDFVVVTIRQSARMRESDARIKATIWHVWHVADGRVREAWTFDSEKDALAAARPRE